MHFVTTLILCAVLLAVPLTAAPIHIEAESMNSAGCVGPIYNQHLLQDSDFIAMPIMPG